MASELLTVPETAAFLDVSRDTVYRLIREGQLPHVRLGRLLRVPRTKLDEWLETETSP